MKIHSTSRVKKHTGHDDLVGEHPWGDTGQIICLIIFLGIWILDSFVFKFSTFLANYIPVYIRITLGALVLGYSGWMARAGLKIVFGEKREKSEVIKKGVFSKVRHPIYLGAILLYLGLIFFTFSLLSLGFWLFIIIPFYIWISKYEEKILANHFGDKYLDYKKKVPMLFPRILHKGNN